MSSDTPAPSPLPDEKPPEEKKRKVAPSLAKMKQKEEFEQEMKDIQNRVDIMKKTVPKSGRTIDDIAPRDRESERQNEMGETLQGTEEQLNRQREPSMVEAEMVRDIARALHMPDRREALLHSDIMDNIVAAVGEMEAIERAAKGDLIGQLDELARLNERYVKVRDHETDEEPTEEELLKLFKRVVEQRRLIYENTLDLESMMQGINDAFELVFSARGGKRAEHGVKNIGSIVNGPHNMPNFEDEASKGLLRKLREKMAGGQ